MEKSDQDVTNLAELLKESLAVKEMGEEEFSEYCLNWAISLIDDDLDFEVEKGRYYNVDGGDDIEISARHSKTGNPVTIDISEIHEPGDDASTKNEKADKMEKTKNEKQESRTAKEDMKRGIKNQGTRLESIREAIEACGEAKRLWEADLSEINGLTYNMSDYAISRLQREVNSEDNGWDCDSGRLESEYNGELPDLDELADLIVSALS